MRVEKKDVFVAWDGKEFIDEEDCVTYERLNLAPTVKTVMYLHSDRESNCEMGTSLNLSEEAMDLFSGVLYEVSFKLEVNRITGETYCTHLNDVELVKPARVC